MGNGGFAKGKLTYTKTPSGKGLQSVKVSGTLTNAGFKIPNTPVAITTARYVVTGEQSYDPAKRNWVSGKLTIDLLYDMSADNKPIGDAKGQMIVTFEKVAGG
jgi:hypothetical protein